MLKSLMIIAALLAACQEPQRDQADESAPQAAAETLQLHSDIQTEADSEHQLLGLESWVSSLAPVRLEAEEGFQLETLPLLVILRD